MMPSPFPGMDPYLESYLWPDVHIALANKIRQQLNSQLRPRYVARLEISVIHDEAPETEIGVMYPDVEVLKIGRAVQPPVKPTVRSTVAVAETAPLTIPLAKLFRVKIPTVEIREAKGNQLIGCIEILSPVNKREPDLTRYREKKMRLRKAGIHLLEIDLLRRGSRSVVHDDLPTAAYLMTLVRAERSVMELWPIQLADPLPKLPVPLLPPDPDAVLDLGLALSEVYDEASYDLSIDYSQPPPPPALSDTEQRWLTKRVADWTA